MLIPMCTERTHSTRANQKERERNGHRPVWQIIKYKHMLLIFSLGLNSGYEYDWIIIYILHLRELAAEIYG